MLARRWTRLGMGLSAVAALVLTAGCQSSGSTPAAQVAAGAVEQKVAAAKITISPASSSMKVSPGDPVTVTAANGKLTDVSVVDEKSREVAGELSANGASWTSTEMLRLDTHYRVDARAVDDAGLASTGTSFFTTVAPRAELTTSISPISGSTVGIGMPIIVRFNKPVRNKADVERALVVRTEKPITGRWNWITDEEVHFRPRTYWPAYTDVTLKVRLKHVNAGRGVWGLSNRTVRFQTGASMVSVVDVDRHTLTVRRNGQVARTIPVSTGKDGFLTRNGIKVVLEKHTLKIMDAATIGIRPGDPEYYRLEVPYAMRVTWSGEFVHAAPWSVGSQGRDNVSHGCVGMSMSNAIWLFNQTNIGDIVQVVGSSRGLEPGNGYTDWNVSWREWKQGSAL